MIKFESEKSFEDMLFKHVQDTFFDPVTGDPLIGGIRQPSLGAFGIGDMLFINEYHPLLTCRKGKRYLHLVELKITPLMNSHIAQVCRYQEFFKNIENLEKFGVNEVKYSLINYPSQLDKNSIYLAKACGIELYQYSMSMDGISFDHYQDPNDDTELCDQEMEKLMKAMGVENVS